MIQSAAGYRQVYEQERSQVKSVDNAYKVHRIEESVLTLIVNTPGPRGCTKHRTQGAISRSIVQHTVYASI